MVFFRLKSRILNLEIDLIKANERNAALLKSLEKKAELLEINRKELTVVKKELESKIRTATQTVSIYLRRGNIIFHHTNF